MTFSDLPWAKKGLSQVLFEREEIKMVSEFSDHDEIS